MITQILTLSRLIAFTWEICFSRIKLIYTTIIQSIIIYDFIIWHASHERSNSVVVATKTLIKLQQQSLRLINNNFKTISMQILETKTHVQLIQLHMTRVQIFFKQRMKKHRHDVLIMNFCRQIKHRLFEARRRRRRKIKKTSTASKIKWTQAMHVKLFANERKNVLFSNKVFIKFFLKKWRNMWSAYQTKNRRKVCETLMKNITSKKMKLHKNLIKSKSFFVIHMKTKRIKLINYFFFRRVFIVLTSKLFLRTFKTNVTTHSIFLQKLIKESSTHAARRRNNEHEQTFECREEFKNLDHLIDENQFINSILIDSKIFRLKIRHFARLICYANDLQLLILKMTTYKWV
jgi:hypothetical protein